MGKVFVHVTMSLDGFMAGPNVSVARPMGEGGERLHEWLFHRPQSEVDAEVVRELFEVTGAVVLGKRTFDVGLGEWGDTPYPVPSFVVTHEEREPLAMTSGTFTFVTDGVRGALDRATAAAGGKDVSLMGADITQQVLRAGLLDEIRLQIAPVMLGAGTRLFDHLGTDPVELQRIGIQESPHVTHVRYRVLSPS